MLDAICADLGAFCNAAASDADIYSFREAADFAGRIEEISRTLDYLQLVAAKAVDRTRRQASLRPASGTGGSSDSWTTGWRELPATGPDGAGILRTAPSASPAPDPPETTADDGYRNTVEFLRGRLRISAAEARRRLALSEDLLPRAIIAGQFLPVRCEKLGAAVAAAKVSSRNASIVTVALERVRGIADPGSLTRMEHALTRTAEESDPDFLTRVARRWTDAIDQDGAEPSEELLRRLQGAFIRKPRHGLHHMEIFATPDQFEHLVTVMNTAANPRIQGDAASSHTGDCDGGGGGSVGSTATGGGNQQMPTFAGGPESRNDGDDDAVELDRRSRPQKLLDGLVGACKVALTSGMLPATGGLRPQVMVTIDYRDLLSRLLTAGTPAGTGDGSAEPWGSPAASSPKAAVIRTEGDGGRLEHTGSLLFGGPVNAATVRKLACDADIIPVVLGGEGRILDIGRTSRIFPPHIRKAIAARDQGCAFPGCTIPAPWCEAHHICYWSRGGSTGTDNGTLLCSYHHHLTHKEQWAIHVRDGIPWFIPPPHIDPQQRPRRNSFFRPPTLMPAS